MDELIARRTLHTADGWVAAALTGLLFCVYLLTASLTFVSDDELFIFDTAESLARHASVLLNETGDLNWPGDSEVEPVMPLLAAPVFWLALQFEGIGNVHATLLLNPALTALTAALVFFWVRQLAYDRRTALLAALAFGLATIAWPYTKTFFRETTHMVTLFAAGYCFVRLRGALEENSPLATGWLAASILAAVVSLFAKEAALYALPVMLILFVPLLQMRQRGIWLRLGLGVILTAAAALIALAIYDYYFGGARFNIAGRLNEIRLNLVLARDGLVGFLFSPGKSIFLFSPPIILALAAPFVVERSRRFDTVWPLILLAVSVLIYALVRGQLWWGGTNWGPRYMVPMTPFLVAAAAPVFEAALQFSPKRLWATALAALTVLGGIAVQAGGVSVRLHDYYEAIEPVQPGAPWTVGLWDPYYSAITTHWRLMFTRPPDFAWVQALAGGPAWAVVMLCGTLIAAFAAALVYGLRAGALKRRQVWLAALGGFLVTGLITWLSLHAIFYDRRYQGDNEALHQLNAALAQASAGAPDPVIFLNNRTYFNFMINYYKGPHWWYTLKLNPSDLWPADQPRPAPSTDPRTLLPDEVHAMVNCFGRIQPPNIDPYCEARQHATAFIIMEFGPFTPQSPRPLEWWMSRNFFYRAVYEFGPTVRLVEFSTRSPAPQPADPPANPANYMLGETIRFTGWDADPDGGSLRPGGVLQLSTRWEAVAAPQADYKIGTYVISPEGSVVAQDDSFPVNGFWPTLEWQAGDVIRHNVAMTLPADAGPGFYEVWTLMYSALDGSRLPVTDSAVTTIRDHIVLLTIEVTR